MKVLIPSPLRSYTGGRSEVEGAGATVVEVLDDLDRRHPGLKFRMVDEQGQVREHMRVFVNGESCRSLEDLVGPTDEVFIVQALSGG